MRYDEYLEINALLQLQNGRSQTADGRPEHDEMLFIIIHQVYELWFKQVLHEVDYLGRLLTADDLPRALHTLRRTLTILKTMVAQVDILETMTPQEFLSFRGYLDTASGFQSAQFRELEFALGHKRPKMMDYHEENPTAHAQLLARYHAPTLWDTFLHLLARHGYAIPTDQLGAGCDSAHHGQYGRATSPPRAISAG
jgi:tryptophan 2,3-dioxygenase